MNAGDHPFPTRGGSRGPNKGIARHIMGNVKVRTNIWMDGTLQYRQVHFFWNFILNGSFVVNMCERNKFNRTMALIKSAYIEPR